MIVYRLLAISIIVFVNLFQQVRTQQFVNQGPFQNQQLAFQQQQQFNCPAQSQQVIRQCAQELRQFGIFVQTQNEIDALTWEQIRRRSRQFFTQICDSYRRFDQCVAPYKLQCWYQEPIKGEFAAVAGTLDYICGEGYFGLYNNWDCYVQVSQRNEVINCEAQLLAESKVSSAASFSSVFNVNVMRDDYTMCRHLQDYMQCVKDPIYSQCGQQAWDNVREAVQRPTRVYMPDCVLAASSLVPSIALLLLATFCLFFV